jgi:hypothetical protein
MQRLLTILLLAITLVGCGTTQTSTSQPPISQTPIFVETQPGTGIITGVMLDENDTPIEGLGVYVATIEGEAVIGFSLNNAPRGITDSAGAFAIPNIQPGTYALAYWTPGMSGIIGDPKGAEQPVKVTVVADQTVSAGNLKINRP